MAMREVPTHYLRPNERIRIPQRVIYLDTESSWRDLGDRQEHTLRLWCATAIRRDVSPNEGRDRVEAEGTTAAGLADWIESTVGRSSSWWLYTHNLNFDLAVTALPLELARRGWRLGKHALATDNPWARMSRGRASITMADSHSWLATSLAAIGEAIGLAKPELPDNDDSEGAWLTRCRADTNILATAMEQLMARWLGDECGNWGVTGAASGWSYMRHICRDQRVLIDTDPAARAFERAAISGGRRELAYKGELAQRWYVALDARHAFATICRDIRLPVARGGHIRDCTAAGTDIGHWAEVLMADCLLEPRSGRYALDCGSGWFYPRGRFWARLCGPELRQALDRGEVARVGEAYWYQLGRYMQPWAERVITELEAMDREHPTLWQLVCKGWSRTTPGRWAVRSGRVERELPWPGQHWEIEDGYFPETRAPMRVLSIPPVRQYIVRDQDGESSLPAVLAWIQAEVRVRLNALLDALDGAWLQCNTDGCIVDVARLAGHGSRLEPDIGMTEVATRRYMEGWIAEHAPAWAPLEFEIRDAFFAGELISPQHVRVGGELRLAGIPRGARQVGRTEFRYNAWGRLPSQIREHPGAGYTITRRTADLAGTTTNRWHLADGRCEVPEVYQVKPGGPIVPAPWEAHALARHRRLHPVQHPFLARAMRGVEA